MKRLETLGVLVSIAALLGGCGSDDSDGAAGGAAGASGATSGGSGGSGATATGGAGQGGAGQAGGAGSGGSAAAGAGGGAATGGSAGAGGSAGTGGGTAGGKVDFVAIYEAGSAWIGNTKAQATVNSVFADFESNLRTSGNWNAKIEVYLTDDNTGFANTTFDKSSEIVNVGGQQVRVVGAWKKIVRGGTDPNGPAQADGKGAEFTVHFNVATQADNRGLLRHEMMHGLGAVGTGPWFSMSQSDVLSGPMPGDRKKRDLYDLQLVDLHGKPLHAEYDPKDQTFKVQNYSIETKYTDWTDGDAGLFFRGKAADGKTKDMSLGTFPSATGGAQLRMNEISEVMSASSHPTWHTIDEPDRLFFRAMGYNLSK